MINVIWQIDNFSDFDLNNNLDTACYFGIKKN